MIDRQEPRTSEDPPKPRTKEGGGLLARTLGLKEALTIGIGTMLGAGIFIFPGLAADRAGLAGALSFALGGCLALLVAAPTAELATALPASGGGYTFVSRALGAGAGSLVGIGQWVGLIFAGAFYLAGFGHYLLALVDWLGLETGPGTGIMGCALGVVLTIVAILGTRASGRLQYYVVGMLLALLLSVLAWGVLRMLAAPDTLKIPSEFAPRGALSVATTAALIFTSYLGFVQVTNVAGEVRSPGRNLPRAIIGSVCVVGVLYVVLMLVASLTLGTEAMAAAGETAMTRLGEALFGSAGVVLVIGAGLLATLSSANASILSASRALFALSRDELMPQRVRTISRRFHTPYVSLLMTGGPMAVLVCVGRLETLAEVASILHLVLYGLMCVAALVLRRSQSSWYRPSFRAPGGLWVPAAGAAGSFALIAFMSGQALVWGAVVLAAATVWRFTYGRDVQIPVPDAPP